MTTTLKIKHLEICVVFFLNKKQLHYFRVLAARNTVKILALNIGFLYVGKYLSMVQPWDKFIYNNKRERANHSVKRVLEIK